MPNDSNDNCCDFTPSPLVTECYHMWNIEARTQSLGRLRSIC